MKIQLVNVLETGISPDPIVVYVNDIVIWAFSNYQTNDIVLIDNETDIIKNPELSKSITQRRHLSYSFKEPGVYHFASPSFDCAIESTSMEAIKGLEVIVHVSILILI